MTRTLSIAIKENTYQDLRQRIGTGKISSFVNQAVEKELQQLIQAEEKQREELRQKLITGYQTRTKNKNLQKTLQTYGGLSLKDLSVSGKLVKQGKKNARQKK